MSKLAKPLLLTLGLCLIGSSSAMAANLSFTGSFANDSDRQFFAFTLLADSSAFFITTLSLNGGINSVGTTIAAAGFDPYLSIWDKNTGSWIFDTSTKNIGAEAIISSSSYGTLLAGNYILALTQNDNIAFGSYLSEGFAADYGLASFDPGLPFTSYGGGGSGHWAVDIFNVGTMTVSVPTPGTLPLTVISLIMLRWVTRNKPVAVPNPI